MKTKVKEHPFIVHIVLSYVIALAGVYYCTANAGASVPSIFEGMWDGGFVFLTTIAFTLVMPVVMLVYHTYLTYEVLTGKTMVAWSRYYDIFTMIYSLICSVLLLIFSYLAVISNEPLFTYTDEELMSTGLLFLLALVLAITVLASFIVWLECGKKYSTRVVIGSLSSVYITIGLLAYTSFCFYKLLMFFSLYSLLPLIVFVIIAFKHIFLTLNRYRPVDEKVNFWSGWLRYQNDVRKWAVMAAGIAMIILGSGYLLRMIFT